MTRLNQNTRRLKEVWAKVLVVVTLFTGMVSGALANPANPQSLEEVNVSRRMMDALRLASQAMANPPQIVADAMPSIARTILLQGYSTISTQRLKTLLKWSGESAPQFMPGLVPESGYLGQAYYVFERAQNWRAISPTELSIELVWAPVIHPKYNHYIETQWYRKEGDAWYLYKQDRRQIPGCNKWPLCVGDPT